jgi:Domain of unknown function (DUF4160)
MPSISMFYGVIIYMYFFDNKKHNLPHIHAEYGEYTVVLSINSGAVIEGSLPSKQLKMVQAWMAIHEDELMADWKLAVNGQELFRIDPLK